MAPAPDATRPHDMPGFGLGTWQNTDAEQCATSVRTALETGYRHVDTAQAYGNEAAVGAGIASASVDRSEVFLATKVWHSELAHDDVISSTESSLDRLDVEHLDLLYVHWPAGAYDAGDTLSAFAELRETGRIDRIGVSNFTPEHLEAAMAAVDAPIFANQVEMHPLLPQRELRAYCRDVGVEVVAYSPLARGRVFDVDVIVDVAAAHDVSPAQVSLAWLLEKDVTPIPKATSEAHIRDDWAARELSLTDEEVARIDAIDRTDRRVDPPFAPASW